MLWSLTEGHMKGNHVGLTHSVCMYVSVCLCVSILRYMCVCVFVLGTALYVNMFLCVCDCVSLCVYVRECVCLSVWRAWAYIQCLEMDPVDQKLPLETSGL